MSIAINVISEDKPGVLRDIAGVVAGFNGNIKYLQQFILARGLHKNLAIIHMEIEDIKKVNDLIKMLKSMSSVKEVTQYEPFEKIWGSRVIIIGGGGSGVPGSSRSNN